MFLFTAAANDTLRLADSVADFNRGPYVLDPIKLSMISNALHVFCLFTCLELDSRYYR